MGGNFLHETPASLPGPAKGSGSDENGSGRSHGYQLPPRRTYNFPKVIDARPRQDRSKKQEAGSSKKQKEMSQMKFAHAMEQMMEQKETRTQAKTARLLAVANS